MKATFLFVILALLLGTGTYAQSIKMTLAGVTAAGGETLLAVEQKTTNSSVVAQGSGGGSGKVAIGSFKIKKENSTSTNQLFKRALSGQHTQQISFDYYDNTGTVYYTIVLKDVIFTEFDYLTPECAGCAKLNVQLAIDFSQIEVTDVATGTSIKYNKTTNSFY